MLFWTNSGNAAHLGRALDAAARSTQDLVLIIPRAQVDQCQPGPVICALMELTDSRERVERFAGSLRLCLEGRQADRRPPWLSSAVVRYFAAVHRMWPYWLHFVATEPDTTLRTVLALLGQRGALDLIDALGGLPVLPEMDWWHREVLCELGVAMKVLHDAMDVDEDARSVVTGRLKLAMSTWPMSRGPWDLRG